MSRPDGCRFPELEPRHDAALREAVAWILDRCEGVVGIVAAGSIVRGAPDASSDLDLFVVHDRPRAQRLQRRFGGVAAEVFLNSPATARDFLERDRERRVCPTAHMLATGFVVLERDDSLSELREEARCELEAPPPCDEAEDVWERYACATLHEDAADVLDRDPETASLILTHEVWGLLRHRHRQEHRWIPRLKELLDRTAELDPELTALARRFFGASRPGEQLELAGRVAERMGGARGFFAWDSAPVDEPGAATPDPDAEDWNYCQSNAAFMGCADPGEVLETPLVHLSSCGAPIAVFNKAFLKAPLGDVSGAVAKARSFFGERGLPFCVEVRSDLAPRACAALEAQGLRETARTPAMRLAPLRAAPAPPEGLRIREARSDDELAAFRRVAFEGFGLPVAAAEVYLGPRLTRLPSVRAWVGYAGDQPACTALLFSTPPVAGVFWVATLEAFRGRGFGAAATWAAVEGGRRAGCRWASLQASALGRPVYERMGFETPCHHVRFEPQG